MGTTVIGGMLAASALGIFFVPAVFCVVEKFSKAERKNASPANAMPAPAELPGTGDD
jgi:HAE1 family hydrophobic/amphiphilic exporter-1